jgi:RNA polymerase sigma factor (sigma-70 family)
MVSIVPLIDGVDNAEDVLESENADHCDGGSFLDDDAANTLLTEVSALAHSMALDFSDLIGIDDAYGDAAEDIAQEIVLDCLIRIREGRWCARTTVLRSYVRNAVYLKTLDYLRRTIRRTDRNAEHVREWCESTHAWMSPDLASEDRELYEFHQRILADVPEICRRTYLMIREGDVSYDEVAEQLGVTRSAVRANVVRAQKVLRARLLERGIVAPPAAKGGC